MPHYLVWDRPEKKIDGSLLDASVPLTYEVALGTTAFSGSIEGDVVEVSDTKIALADLGDYVGKVVFVRAKTINGTVSSYSLGLRVGVPAAPTGLKVVEEF